MSKPRIAIALDLEHPFPHHTQVFAGTQHYAAEHDWECVIDDFPGYRPGERSSAFRRYDGIIARAHPEMLKQARRQQVPLVNTWFSAPVGNVPGVYADFREIARLVAEHLLERGFRRICYFNTIGSRDTPIIRRKLEQIVTEAGGTVVAFEHPSVEALNAELWLRQERVLSRALDRLTPPVGIFCGSSSAMRYLVNLCQERGWNVPQDAAVVTTMETPGLVDYPRPSITHIDMNWQRVGYEAAALLGRMLAGAAPPKRPIWIPPRGVVARESTDFFAMDDAVVAGALNYIAKNLAKPLSIEHIAHALSLSPRTLQLHFNTTLDTTVAKSVVRLRLEAAKRMLADKTRRIGDIAEQAGFISSTRMNEVFRRELGMTPSAYRRQRLEKGRY